MRDQKHTAFLIYRYFGHKIYDKEEIKRLYKFYTNGQKAHPLGQNAHPGILTYHSDRP